jgi:hypothetical protein
MLRRNGNLDALAVDDLVGKGDPLRVFRRVHFIPRHCVVKLNASSCCHTQTKRGARVFRLSALKLGDRGFTQVNHQVSSSLYGY